ncbi:MAG: fructosamine kinase family protein [Gammaproteobacteria bacterium]
MWSDIAAEVSEKTGKNCRLGHPVSVSGGCINQAWRVPSSAGELFIKVNQASKLAMFEAEEAGLRELQQCRLLNIPVPICSGVADEHSWLVMNDLELGGSGNSIELGRGLAEMHGITAEKFGWLRENTIGSTRQINTLENDWLTFWREHRLRIQLEMAAVHGAGSQFIGLGESLLISLPDLLADHQPAPSLLHGDLWSGNYAWTLQGKPAIFDPAVYYGDRETDLAMTKLFGGFGKDFYAAYEERLPLSTGYALRKNLYNLYHVLNHFNLFGGSYLSQARAMMQRLLSEVKG